MKIKKPQLCPPIRQVLKKKSFALTTAQTTWAPLLSGAAVNTAHCRAAAPAAHPAVPLPSRNAPNRGLLIPSAFPCVGHVLLKGLRESKGQGVTSHCTEALKGESLEHPQSCETITAQELLLLSQILPTEGSEWKVISEVGKKKKVSELHVKYHNITQKGMNLVSQNDKAKGNKVLQ